jgi:tetratricopeptide (TPR) repeat protein
MSGHCARLSGLAAFAGLCGALLPLPVAHAAERSPVIEATVRDYLDFAEDLFQSGDYRLALIEFRRVMRLTPAPDVRLYAQLYAISCYIELGDFDHALVDLASLPHRKTEVAQKEIQREAKLKLGEIHYLRGSVDLAVRYFTAFLEQYPDDERAPEVQLKLAMAYVELEMWDQARVALINARTSELPLTRALALVAEGPPSASKSPWLAGIMSAIIPGTGQMYAGRWLDGLVALLLVGVFAAGTYEAVVNETRAAAGVVGFVGLGCYAGNIFAAVSSAQRANQDQHQLFKDQLSEDLRTRVGTGAVAPESWKISFDFPF